MPVLYARRERPVVGIVGPPARTRSRGVADLLLDVLESVESYDAHIAEAERDEDVDLAAFLRELRRQDLVRSRGVVRLLRRSREEPEGFGEEVGAC